MEVATITRKYVYQDGNNNSIELDDIDYDLSHEQIMEHYAQLVCRTDQRQYHGQGYCRWLP